MIPSALRLPLLLLAAAAASGCFAHTRSGLHLTLGEAF
jgi:hypothetical protein